MARARSFDHSSDVTGQAVSAFRPLELQFDCSKRRVNPEVDRIRGL